uniref:Uncharacterized protein n=1 Tax=Leersia perrieri TaxID=77586 RepID=A0A0D9WT70_9ORYZ
MPPNHGHRRLPVDMAAGICADSCCRQQIGGRRHWLALPFNACRDAKMFKTSPLLLGAGHKHNRARRAYAYSAPWEDYTNISDLAAAISTPVTRRCWKRSLLTTTSDFPTDFQFSACRRVRGCMLRQPDVNRNEHHSLFSSIFYIIC